MRASKIVGLVLGMAALFWGVIATVGVLAYEAGHKAGAW